MRTFIAINLTDDERDRIQQAGRALRDADFPIRWIRPENVHLTLKFLGEVDEDRIGELSEAIDRTVAGLQRFTMMARDFGAFPSSRRPRVVWVGIEPDDVLTELYGRLEAELESLGFERETREFKPHLTVGRARRRSRPRDFDGFDEAVESVEYEDRFEVGSVDLMRSELGPGGAKYSVVHSAKLSRS